MWLCRDARIEAVLPTHDSGIDFGAAAKNRKRAESRFNNEASPPIHGIEQRNAQCALSTLLPLNSTIMC
jgi:hypothetical protein